MKKPLLIFSILLFSIQTSVGQCKYDFDDTDPMSGKSTFRTKNVIFSKKVKKKGVFGTSPIGVQFDKSGTDEQIIMNCSVSAGGTPIMYNSYTDSLTIKFEDGEALTLAMKTMAVSSVKGYFAYALTDAVKAKFKSGKKVTVVRIGGSQFNIDISEPLIDITAKFNECWKA